MDVFLWIFFFLPISKALMPLEEIMLRGELGGSIDIKCPLKNPPQRYYFCREIKGLCSTVVSSTTYVGRDYQNRVSLKLLPDEKMFLVELRNLKEEDSGSYACGIGRKTDKGKTLKVILKVTPEYNPFWGKPDYSEHLPLPWSAIYNEASSLTTQVSTTLEPLEEIMLYGELGGSIGIRCPLKNPPQKYYLCREISPGLCSTVVSSTSFVGPDYQNRVSLKLLPDEMVFLVELRNLKEEDSGSYACGIGKKTDKGKTLKVILTVSPEYNSIWGEPDYSEHLPFPSSGISNEASSLTTQVSTTLEPLEEIMLYGELGGSIGIRCPLKNPPQKYYLCREISPGLCSTVVSSTSFVGPDYQNRVSLKLLPDEKMFLVELRNLKEEDSGSYACGIGRKTDKGKTLKVILTVSPEYNPFWGEPDYSEHLPLPWSGISNEASSLTTQAASTSAPWTQPGQTQPPLDPSPTSPILPQRATLAAAPTFQTSRSSVISKSLHLRRLLRPSTVSYSHNTRLRGESASYFGSSMKKDGGFHILIPATLGIILMMLLGLVLGRSLQKRRVLSRRINRLTMRMSALEASQRTHSHLHGSHQRRFYRPVSNRLRSQYNIYSACPRQVQRPNQNGEQMPTGGPGIAEPSPPTQVSKTAQLQAPVPVKNEYMSTYSLCVSEQEDSDSHDYINVSCLTQIPSCAPGLHFHNSKDCR